jgi:hypothetical protein
MFDAWAAAAVLQVAPASVHDDIDCVNLQSTPLFSTLEIDRVDLDREV